MKRRMFLATLGAAGATALMPMPLRTAPIAAGYNRYMYGLAVFQARTRASLSATDLIAKLRVSPATAKALINEMTASGVLKPALHAAAGTMQAVSPNATTRATFASCADAAQQFWTPDDAVAANQDPKAQVSEPDQTDAKRKLSDSVACEDTS